MAWSREGEELEGWEGEDVSGWTESSMSEPLRQMSKAVQPAANAPATAEKKLTAHAGVGWPMYVTHENMRQKNQQQSDQKG